MGAVTSAAPMQLLNPSPESWTGRRQCMGRVASTLDSPRVVAESHDTMRSSRALDSGRRVDGSGQDLSARRRDPSDKHRHPGDRVAVSSVGR